MLVKRTLACQIGAMLTLSWSLSGCTDAEAEKKLDSLALDGAVAYWAVRGRDEEKNNYIRPVVRFRVKNRGERAVGYIQAMAVFKIESLPDEPWGNAFSYSISDAPIPAGGVSETVALRGDHNFISKDPPERMFENEKWEDVEVEVFLRVGPSSWRIVETLPVPRHLGAPGVEQFLNTENKEVDAKPEGR